jgi:hypothetical protein
MTATGMKSTLILGLSLLFFSVMPAAAQTAYRTYVSGSIGNDSNPCTSSQPCLTLRVAMTQTRTGGEVNVLDATEDTGLFGIPVTISKSISIVAAGGRPGIIGVLVVSPEAGGQVLLRGMDIVGVLAADALQVTTGAGLSLIVDDCTIQGGANGINFSPAGTATSSLVVRNSVITHNGAGLANAGILIQPTGTTVNTTRAVIENSNVNNNILGIRAFDYSTVTVRNSVVTESVWAGIRSEQLGSGAVTIFVEHTQVSHNGGNGVLALGPSTGLPMATIRLSDVTITDNGAGIAYANGGIVYSFGNNSVAGNPSTLPPTPIPLT